MSGRPGQEEDRSGQREGKHFGGPPTVYHGPGYGGLFSLYSTVLCSAESRSPPFGPAPPLLSLLATLLSLIQ